jgi:hypothetical protein
MVAKSEDGPQSQFPAQLNLPGNLGESGEQPNTRFPGLVNSLRSGNHNPPAQNIQVQIFLSQSFNLAPGPIRDRSLKNGPRVRDKANIG